MTNKKQNKKDNVLVEDIKNAEELLSKVAKELPLEAD